MKEHAREWLKHQAMYGDSVTPFEMAITCLFGLSDEDKHTKYIGHDEDLTKFTEMLGNYNGMDTWSKVLKDGMPWNFQTNPSYWTMVCGK